MRFLTVRQPWASAIFDLGKNVENRTWPTVLRGRIGIHAGLALDRLGIRMIGTKHVNRNDLGVILGTVQLIGCHEATGPECLCSGNPWAFWPSAEVPRIFHLMLAEQRALVTPFHAVGKLQFWEGSPSESHLTEIGEFRA